jgi:hypothetical protein
MDFYFLSNQSNISTSLLWAALQADIHSAFADGPVQGNTYQFRMFVLQTGNQSVGPFDSTELVYDVAPFPPSTVTAAKTLTGISVQWELFGVDLTEIGNFHVYTRVNDGDPVQGSTEVNGFHYLGQTGNNTSTELIWEVLADNISPAFAEGPQFGNLYLFRLIPIKTDGKALSPIDTTEQLFFDIEPPVPTVSAAETETSITISWDLKTINPATISKVHVYAKVNEGETFIGFNSIDGFYFLTEVGDNTTTSYDWTANGSGLAQNFIPGPQPGDFYQFRIFLFDQNNKPKGPFTTESSLLFTSTSIVNPFVVTVTDDTKTTDDLSYQVDSDLFKERGLTINWDYTKANPAIDTTTITETHIQIVGESGINSFLKRVSADVTSLTWAPFTTTSFPNGPEYGQAYQFRVIAFMGADRVGFTNLGPVTFVPKLLVTDDALLTSTEDVSNNTGHLTGEDIDSDGDRALAIHWDFSDIILDSADIAAMQLLVEVDGARKQFMRSMSQTELLNKGVFEWKDGATRLAGPFKEGPTPRTDGTDRTYKFRLFVKLQGSGTWVKDETGTVTYK